jgi:transposase
MLEEFDSSDLATHIELTAETPTWDPNSDWFQNQEESMLDHTMQLRHDMKRSWRKDRHILSLNVIKDLAFVNALTSNVKVMLKSNRNVSVVKSGNKLPSVTATTLAKRWNIGLKSSLRTLEGTTQKTIRSLQHPMLSRRFKTNDRQFRYRRIPHTMFTDTLESKVTSWHRKNRYAQIFATSFGWTRVYLMMKKSKAHFGLQTLFKREGAPITIVMDGSREQTLGEFRKKAREAGCRIKQTEPYSPWQNAAEGAIRELKKGAGRKAAKSHSPEKLWDHCLELEGMIRSHTCLEHHELQGQVPETLISGQTADISSIVEHGWYDWVKFYDQNAKFPEPKEFYGRWLGPAPDIGPAMASKILKSNGQIIILSTYRGLSEDELSNKDQIKLRDHFDQMIKQRLGNSINGTNIIQVDPEAVSPYHERHGDDIDPTPNIDDATPENQDMHIGAVVTIPLQGKATTGRVNKKSRTASGDLYGKAKDNTILDTRAYEV